MALQVLLPRVLSVVLWYHLGFLAVTLAMLGFAAGGVLVRRRVGAGRPPGGGLDRGLLASLSAASALAALVLATRLPLQTSEVLERSGDALVLLLLVAVLAVPFVLLGTLVCSALDAGRERFAGTYAATFAGGALGAALTLASLQALGLRRTAAVAALPVLLVALLSRGRRPSPRSTLALVAAAGLVAGLALAPRSVLPLHSRKHFPRVTPEQVLHEDSDALSHVVFYENPEHHGLWIPPAGFTGELPETVGVAIDQWAITFITKREHAEDEPEFLDWHQAGLAYAGAEEGFSALVVGAGGGWDVLGALHAGASHVTAVELNPLIVDAVQDRWAEWSGHLYDDPRVEVHVAEGRAFLEQETRRYDRIVLAGVDTFAATQAGAFALAENYLYTVEAFATYLRRLEPGGMLFLTRWWFEPPRQTLRLLLTLREALEQAGVEDPRRRLFVCQGGNSLVLVRAGEDFTARQLEALSLEAGRLGARTVYGWSRPSHPVLVEAMDAADPLAWAEAYPYRVDPTTDDRPFFFENGRLATLFRAEGNWIHDRLGGQEVLALTLAGLALLGLPLALALRRRDGQDPEAPPRGGVLLPFLLLGLGYMFVEIPLLQRMSLVLGHPVRSVAVVLTGMLVGSGLGSLLARRAPSGRGAALVLAVTAGAIVVVLGLGHEPLGGMIASWGWPLRALAVLAQLALPALLMGACMPLVVARHLARHPYLVPDAFLLNGLASVVAGPLAVMLAMDQGFAATLETGAACYLAAALVLVVTGRTAQPPAAAARSSSSSSRV